MYGDKRLYILRGLPGSGKSTITEELVRIAEALKTPYIVCCHDDDFMIDGKYVFDFDRLEEVHANCIIKAKKAMDDSVPLVIIDNVNLCYDEIYPYVQYGMYKNYVITLQEPQNEYARHIPTLLTRNVHGVPAATYDRMWAKWEESDDVLQRLAYELTGEVDFVTNSIWGL